MSKQCLRHIALGTNILKQQSTIDYTSVLKDRGIENKFKPFGIVIHNNRHGNCLRLALQQSHSEILCTVRIINRCDRNFGILMTNHNTACPLEHGSVELIVVHSLLFPILIVLKQKGNFGRVCNISSF